MVGVASFLLVNFGRPIRLMFYVNGGLLLITAVFFLVINTLVDYVDPLLQ